MKKQIAIIGAGVGGAACGAMLSKEGFDVTIFEAHPFGGGRCAAFERDGLYYDFGVHMFSRGEKGPHGEVTRRIGGDLSWIYQDPAARVVGICDFWFPLDMKPIWKQAQIALKLGVSPFAYFSAWRLFQTMLKGKITKEIDEMTLKDYVSKFTNDKSVHIFINCVAQLYFALSYEECSAGEFVWCFSRMFNEATFGYPKGGAREIPLSFIRAMEKTGGKVRYREPVTKIHVENNKATGVETENGFFPADIVISNAGIALTVELAGKDSFPGAYVQKSGQYTYSNPYITVKYGLNKKVVEEPTIIHLPDMAPEEIFAYTGKNTAPEDVYLFITIPSNQDQNLAKDGKQLVIAGTPAPRGASNDICNAILDKVEKRVLSIFPDMEKHISWKFRATAEDAMKITNHPDGEAIGMAQTPSQMGENRPDMKTPVEGLFLVGTDTRARGIGTELASRSAVILADRLIADYGKPA